MCTKTVHVTRMFGRTLYLTIVFLLLFSGIAEWVTRLEAFQAPLTLPRMGSRHYQLGYKLALLEAQVKQNGPVDCIMLGSSVVDWGFNPDAFQDAFRQATGKEIHCFNFGINASTAASTAVLAKILVEDYHPSLLIIGTDARDYALPITDSQPAVILQTPWIQYRQGHFSLNGWLTEQSYFYRYRQHLAHLMHFRFQNTLRSQTKPDYKSLPNGYTPVDRVADYINNSPDPQLDSFDYLTRIFTSYRLVEDNLDALESMLGYNGMEAQVIIVEMPVSDGLYYFFDNGQADYDLFVSRVNELANLHQVPFLRTEPLDSIPDDGWSDYNHLNVIGAEIFSAWLGGQVASMDIP